MSALLSFVLAAVGAATNSCDGHGVCLLQLRHPELVLGSSGTGRASYLADPVVCPSKECVLNVPLDSRWRTFGNGSCAGAPCQGLRSELVPEEAPPCQNLVPQSECPPQSHAPQLICPSAACVLSKPKNQRSELFEAHCAQSPCSYVDLGPDAPHCHKLVELSVCNGHLVMNAPASAGEVSPADDTARPDDSGPEGNATGLAEHSEGTGTSETRTTTKATERPTATNTTSTLNDTAGAEVADRGCTRFSFWCILAGAYRRVLAVFFGGDVAPRPPRGSGEAFADGFTADANVSVSDSSDVLEFSGWEMIHAGHCAAGDMHDIVTKSTIPRCFDRCRRKDGCGFFAFSEATGACALYEYDLGCPEDGYYPEYSSYRLVIGGSSNRTSNETSTVEATEGSSSSAGEPSTTTTTTTTAIAATTTFTMTDTIEVLPTGGPVPGVHLTGRGCSADLVGTESSNDDVAAAVRCCNDVGGRVSCESRGSGKACLPLAATFAEARQNCSALGMRLCTVQELDADLCCDSACPSEGLRVWSGTLPSTAPGDVADAGVVPRPADAADPDEADGPATAPPDGDLWNLTGWVPHLPDSGEATTATPTPSAVALCSAACPELLAFDAAGCSLTSPCDLTPGCERLAGDAFCCVYEELPVECAELAEALAPALSAEQHGCVERLTAVGCQARHGGANTSTAAPGDAGATTAPATAAPTELPLPDAADGPAGADGPAPPPPPDGDLWNLTGWVPHFPDVGTTPPLVSTAAPATAAAAGSADLHRLPFDDCLDGICDNTEAGVTHLRSVNASSNVLCREICAAVTACDFSSYCPLWNPDCVAAGDEGTCALYTGCQKNATDAWLAEDDGWVSCPRLKKTH